ncbi:MAG: nucleotide-binding protein [Hyphomonas sp.]|uniref:nucleotide-binding protein n=1 Tax=Hyphomonas sp. BRH_c22 TaxID=1629710 RepID=UPI000ADE27C5|nr:nucleotide-binding protein [Hyphomonas sp. BRH_c22]
MEPKARLHIEALVRHLESRKNELKGRISPKVYARPDVQYFKNTVLKIFGDSERADEELRFIDQIFDEKFGAYPSSSAGQEIVNAMHVYAVGLQHEIGIEYPMRAGQNLLSGLKRVSEGSDRKVFLVHGHDNILLQKIRSWLIEKALEPIILSEQPGSSVTLIEMIEQNADVSYAICMLTADDLGGKSADELLPRARQNVILEIGYFFALLTRQRVSVILDEGVEPPSDIIGLRPIHNTIFEDVTNKLESELMKAGLINA